MIDFLYNNLSILSKTLPNIQKAQSEFGRSIEKNEKNEKKLLTRENPNERRTTVELLMQLSQQLGLHQSFIIGQNELTGDFRLLTNTN